MDPGRCIATKCQEPAELGAVFCAAHLQAPIGKRGGWISAERRRRLRGGSMEMPLDASSIVRRLWVGGQPPFDRPMPEFDQLLLCAQEIQPEHIAFQGRVIRVPLPDDALDMRQLKLAILGGRAVARALTSGQRVLVTCAAGFNRSALVASLGLGLCTQLSAHQLVELMRRRRSEFCLRNPYFVEILNKYVGPGRGAR